MHRMDMRSREQYLKALLGRYLKARKRGKSTLLDEYCRNTGMARKSVVLKIAGLLKGESPPWKKRRPVYGRPGRGERSSSSLIRRRWASSSPRTSMGWGSRSCPLGTTLRNCGCSGRNPAIVNRSHAHARSD